MKIRKEIKRKLKKNFDFKLWVGGGGVIVEF